MAAGIIAEYNPFHKGHKYHIEKTIEHTKKDIVAIISGNFVQRGEPAMLDKYTRTKMALLNGVSVVLELPVQYATGSADIFAKGAVTILNSSGIIDALSFGSESGSADMFNDIAEVLNNEPPEFRNLLKNYLNTGLSYPSARNKTLEDFLNKPLEFLNKPNNILALEYVRQLKLLNSSIKPITVKRLTSDYNSTELSGEISSASAIRTALLKNDMSALSSVPENCIKLMHGKKIPVLDDYSDILSYLLCTVPPKELALYADITEGLENRILNTDFKTISELISKTKTKRYTYSKIQKAILHIILSITKEEQQKAPEYIRVLGFRKDKKHLISEMAKKASLPVITNVKGNESLLQKEILSSDIYNILIDNKKGTEYTTPIVIV